MMMTKMMMTSMDDGDYMTVILVLMTVIGLRRDIIVNHDVRLAIVVGQTHTMSNTYRAVDGDGRLGRSRGTVE